MEEDPVLLPGTRKAQGPDPPEAQDIQTERFHRVQALGSLLCPDPHKQGTLPPHDFRSGQEVDGPRRVPRVEGTGYSLLGAHRPPGGHVGPDCTSCPPATGAGAGCAVARVKSRVLVPRWEPGRDLPPLPVPRVAGASTTHFVRTDCGSEPLRLQNRIL